MVKSVTKLSRKGGDVGRGLSTQQKTAIQHIGREMDRKQRAHDEAHPDTRRYRAMELGRGAECPSPDRTNSGLAAWSRAISRLRKRGLVEKRGRGASWLTPEGWKLFRALTGEVLTTGDTAGQGFSQEAPAVQGFTV